MGLACLSSNNYPSEEGEDGRKVLIHPSNNSVTDKRNSDVSINVKSNVIASTNQFQQWTPSSAPSLNWNAKLDQLWILRANSERKIACFRDKLQSTTNVSQDTMQMTQCYQAWIVFYQQQMEEIDKLIKFIRNPTPDYSPDAEETITQQYQQIVRNIKKQEKKQRLQLTGSKEEWDDD